MENRYALMTAAELAEHIVSKLNLKDVDMTLFPDCDFAIAERDCENKPIEEVANESRGWYGIKEVDTGFESGDLCIVADYYGGGCAHFLSIYDGIGEMLATECIREVIFNTLHQNETVYSTTVLLVDIRPEED